MGFFRPSVEFAVRVEGEQARAEGELPNIGLRCLKFSFSGFIVM